MKRKLSDREIAQEMANIMVDHLETLPVEERHKNIQAGQKVIKSLKKSTSSSASGKSAKAPSPSDTSRFPLAARGH